MRYPLITAACQRWTPQLRDLLPSSAVCDIRVGREADTGRARNFAFTQRLSKNRWLIAISPRAEQLPTHKREAILLHEFGHVLDDLKKHVRKRSHHAIELAADHLAEEAFGVEINYDPNDGLQTFQPGIPRPKNLR